MVDAAKVEDSKAKVAQFAARVEAQLADGREWLMGPFSIADLETYAWLRPMRELEADAFAGQDRCLAWMDRVEARPSVQKALARAKTDNPGARLCAGAGNQSLGLVLGGTWMLRNRWIVAACAALALAGCSKVSTGRRQQRKPPPRRPPA